MKPITLKANPEHPKGATFLSYYLVRPRDAFAMGVGHLECTQDICLGIDDERLSPRNTPLFTPTYTQCVNFRLEALQGSLDIGCLIQTRYLLEQPSVDVVHVL